MMTGARIRERLRQGTCGKASLGPFLILIPLFHWLEEGPPLVRASQMLAAAFLLCFVFWFRQFSLTMWLWLALNSWPLFYLFLPSAEITDVSHLLSTCFL